MRFFDIWQRHIPSWVSLFLWRLIHGFLAINDALSSRGFYMVSRCVYSRVVDSFRHLFVDCQQVRQAWVVKTKKKIPRIV